jgi:hypothetical protein
MKMKIIKIVIASTLVVSVLKAQELPAKIKEFGIGLSNFNSFSLQYRWGNEKRIFRVNATIGGTTSFGKGSSNYNAAPVDTTSSQSYTTATKTSSPLNFNTSLSFSMLKLKKINDKFGLLFGPVAGIVYSTSSSQSTTTGTNVNYYQGNTIQTGSFPSNSETKNNSSTIQPYVGLVLGAYYKINASFLIYAEIAPNVYYAHTHNTSYTTNVNKIPTSYNDTNNSTNSNNTFGLGSLSNSGALLTLVYRITK